MPVLEKFIKVPAQRFPFGSRYKYKFSIPLIWAAELFPPLDPNDPQESNRVVEPEHGNDFAEYICNNPDNWIEPGVLLVSQQDIDFEPLFQQSSPKWYGSTEAPIVITGYIRLDLKLTKFLLLYLEGQHRNYGLQEKVDFLLDESSELEAELVRNPENDSAKADLKINQGLINRFTQELLDVTIITPVDPSTQSRWFVTMAREAKGIIRAERERMDEKSITILAAKHVIGKHPFLAGSYIEKGKSIPRVLTRVNKVPQSSPAIFTLPAISDITKNIGFSWAKRATAKKESIELQESIEKITMNFFDDLVECIDDYKKITSDTSFTGKDLRKKTLFSSATFIRVLADVYHRIAIATPESTNESVDKTPLVIIPSGRRLFKELLINLKPFMDYVDRTDPDNPAKTFKGVHNKWMETGLFREKAKVPNSDTQGLGGLSQLLVEWAKTGNVFNPPNINKIASMPKGSI